MEMRKDISVESCMNAYTMLLAYANIDVNHVHTEKEMQELKKDTVHWTINKVNVPTKLERYKSGNGEGLWAVTYNTKYDDLVLCILLNDCGSYKGEFMYGEMHIALQRDEMSRPILCCTDEGVISTKTSKVVPFVGDVSFGENTANMISYMKPCEKEHSLNPELTVIVNGAPSKRIDALRPIMDRVTSMLEFGRGPCYIPHLHPVLPCMTDDIQGSALITEPCLLDLVILVLRNNKEMADIIKKEFNVDIDSTIKDLIVAYNSIMTDAYILPGGTV